MSWDLYFRRLFGMIRLCWFLTQIHSVRKFSAKARILREQNDTILAMNHGQFSFLHCCALSLKTCLKRLSLFQNTCTLERYLNFVVGPAAYFELQRRLYYKVYPSAFLKLRAQLKFFNLWPRAVCQCKGLVNI